MIKEFNVIRTHLPRVIFGVSGGFSKIISHFLTGIPTKNDNLGTNARAQRKSVEVDAGV